MTLNGATGIGVPAEDWQSQSIAAPYFEVRSSEHITRCFGSDAGCHTALGSETRHHLPRSAHGEDPLEARGASSSRSRSCRHRVRPTGC